MAGVELLRTKTSCFNMGSILIKPVQRILKYPLILSELLKECRVALLFAHLEKQRRRAILKLTS